MDDTKEDKRWKIFDEINQERHRQDSKWGEQGHDLIDPSPQSLIEMLDRQGIKSQHLYRALCESKHVSWLDILMEEVSELAEEYFRNADSKASRKELIQVAAVAVSMIECFDRRKHNG